MEQGKGEDLNKLLRVEEDPFRRAELEIERICGAKTERDNYEKVKQKHLGI